MSIIDHRPRTLKIAAGNSRFDAVAVHDEPGQSGRPLVITREHRREDLELLPVRTHVMVNGRILRKVETDRYRSTSGPAAGAGYSSRDVLAAATSGVLPNREMPHRFVPAPRRANEVVEQEPERGARGEVRSEEEPQNVAVPAWATLALDWEHDASSWMRVVETVLDGVDGVRVTVTALQVVTAKGAANVLPVELVVQEVIPAADLGAYLALLAKAQELLGS